jgi:YD repeat-containing protein
MNPIRLHSLRPLAAQNLRRRAASLLLAGLLMALVTSPVLAESLTYVYDVSDPLHIHAIPGATFTTPGVAFISVYDSMQNLVNVSTNDGMGHVTTYAYDGLTRQVQSGATITTPGNGTGAAYDSVGNQLNISTESSGVTTTYAYDAQTRMVQSASDINTSGIATSTVYDSTGNQINVSVPDNLGHTTTYTYDATSRLAQTASNIDTLGHVTTMTYDSTGNQINVSVPDNLGHTTTYAYDGTSRLIRSAETITTPGDATTSFYDSTNRIIGIATYDNGVNTMYLYDAVNRTSVGQIPLAEPAMGAMYDPANNTYLITEIPEPSTFCLLGLATVGFGLLARHRKR